MTDEVLKLARAWLDEQDDTCDGLDLDDLSRILYSPIPTPAAPQCAPETDIVRTVSGESLNGMEVAGWRVTREMPEKLSGSQYWEYASHWSTHPEHQNPIRLFAEEDVRKLLDLHSSYAARITELTKEANDRIDDYTGTITELQEQLAMARNEAYCAGHRTARKFHDDVLSCEEGLENFISVIKGDH